MLMASATAPIGESIESSQRVNMSEQQLQREGEQECARETIIIWHGNCSMDAFRLVLKAIDAVIWLNGYVCTYTYSVEALGCSESHSRSLLFFNILQD